MLIFKHLILQLEVQKVGVILLEQEERTFRGDGLFRRRRFTLGCLPVRPESRGRDVGLATGATDEGSLIVVQPLVQLQVDKLGETQGTFLTSKRFLSLVEPHVGFQVGS